MIFIGFEDAASQISGKPAEEFEVQESWSVFLARCIFTAVAGMSVNLKGTVAKKLKLRSKDSPGMAHLNIQFTSEKLGENGIYHILQNCNTISEHFKLVVVEVNHALFSEVAMSDSKRSIKNIDNKNTIAVVSMYHQ